MIYEFNHIKMNVIEYQLNNLNYELLKKLEPNDLGQVSVFNKQTQSYELKPIFRKYQSYGVEIPFQETGKSYMFNNQTNIIPDELQFYLSYAQSLNPNYNNIYVNWYDSGKNYIEPHSDCTSQLVPNSTIIIINLNEGDYERTFKIQHKDGGDIREIKLSHGKCLMFNSKEQENYRHWVDQEDTMEGRISVTLRMINK
jgi:hypothetical protein